MRRALGERRIGHTGTLDPAATGVLALVLGRATRLAQFLSRSDKSYEAVVRLGFATDTGDAQGRPDGPAIDDPLTLPKRDAIEEALHPFRGTFLQQPPAFSAKKIDGKRSHKLARARARNDARPKPSRSGSPTPEPSELRDLSNLRDPRNLPDSPDPPDLPDPVSVTTYAIEVVSTDGDRVTLRVDCSAGFYVRSLAHDLGERLGVGGHLVSLRRVRSGNFSLADAIDLDSAEREPAKAASRVIPLAGMLPGIAPVVLNAAGVHKAIHGRELGPRDCASGFALGDPLYRLLDEAGVLIAIARPSGGPGALHPSVVLV